MTSPVLSMCVSILGLLNKDRALGSSGHAGHSCPGEREPVGARRGRRDRHSLALRGCAERHRVAVCNVTNKQRNLDFLERGSETK